VNDILALFVQVIVTIVRLIKPGDLRSIVAESVVVRKNKSRPLSGLLHQSVFVMQATEHKTSSQCGRFRRAISCGLILNPQFDGGFTDWAASGDPEGNARYDALQVRLEKRYSDGLYFLGSYTFSRILNDGPGSNTWLGDTSSSNSWGTQDPGKILGT